MNIANKQQQQQTNNNKKRKNHKTQKTNKTKQQTHVSQKQIRNKNNKTKKQCVQNIKTTKYCEMLVCGNCEAKFPRKKTKTTKFCIWLIPTWASAQANIKDQAMSIFKSDSPWKTAH